MNRIPFTDRLLEYSKKEITSFHALPLNSGNGLYKSKLKEHYECLFGKEYLANEVTYGNGWIDNPIFPTDVLKESQEITAKTFHTDLTMYITSGTTVANQIAIFSTINHGDRVLVDRHTHQSIHFSLSLTGAKIQYSTFVSEEESSGRQFINYDSLIHEFQSAFSKGNPFKVVILNASTYEGVINNSMSIIEKILDISEDVTFIVDEAWIAYAAFNDETKKYSILSSINEKRSSYPKLRLICTQSPHKSLNALRQTSYLHVIGDSKLITSVSDIKYKIHTTSPSYPMLSSLELAREDMVINGNDRIQESLNLVKLFRSHMEKYSNLSISSKIPKGDFWALDPLRLSVNFKNTNLDVNDVKIIFQKHDLYISRFTQDSFLLNFHLGINENNIDRLKNALKELNNTHRSYITNSTSNEYVIPYPPGVPVLVPGEIITRKIIKKINMLENCKTKIMKIKG